LHPLRKEDVVIRILVTGSRDWDYALGMVAFYRAMQQFFEPLGQYDYERDAVTVDLEIVHGAYPRGLDMIAREWCIVNSVPDDPFEPDWEEHGKAAGPIRNQQMVDSGADACLGFPLSESRGTLDCMTRAHRASIPVWKCGPEGIEPWTP